MEAGCEMVSLLMPIVWFRVSSHTPMAWSQNEHTLLVSISSSFGILWGDMAEGELNGLVVVTSCADESKK